MAFINYNNKQDMQDDTYKIVALRLNEIMQYLMETEEDRAYKTIRTFFCLVAPKLKRKKEIREKIDTIRLMLYSRRANINNQNLSKAVDSLMEVYEDICDDLNDSGILFRAEANPNELYKRGSHG